MTPDTFFDNFAFLTDAPNGIQKLHELILQLAVQGKLVPQDPEDEPAAELVKRIAAEKNRLVSEGKIKVQEPLAKVVGDEIGFKLPANWFPTRVGELLTVIRGASPRPKGDPKYFSVERTPYRWIKISDIRKHSVGRVLYDTDEFLTKAGMEKSVLLPKGTLVMTNSATIGIPIFLGFDGGCIHDGYLAFPYFPDSEISKDFFFILFQTLQSYAVKMARGMAQLNLNTGLVRNFPLGLPPLAEQHRIVAKVDQLVAICDDLEAKQQQRSEVRERLSNTLIDKLLAAHDPAEFDEHWQRICEHFDLLYDTPDTIGKLRQAILQLAVQGKLVPQDASDEPASILLKKINDKKEKLTKEGKRKKTNALSPIKEEEQPFVAPKIWEWARFGEIADIASGVTLGRQLGGKQTVAYPYLRVANVQRGYLDLSKIKEVEILVSELDKYQLRMGDILLTEGGDWDKLGRAAIWEDQISNCLHQNHIFRARPIVKELQPRWIILYMNSFTGQRYFQEASKQTTNLASINMTQLRRCPIPLPPPKTQSQILAKVDQLMAFCDDLEAKLKQAQAGSEKLAVAMVQSLLAA